MTSVSFREPRTSSRRTGISSAGTEELAVSAVLIGAIIGGIFGGKLADSISRRYALLALAGVYSLGAIATALAPSLLLFIVFRIIVGVAVGASSMIVPPTR